MLYILTAIQNCLGVVIEPKNGENPAQLREIYEYKLKQLAHKRAVAAREERESQFRNEQYKEKSRIPDIETEKVSPREQLGECE